MALHPQMTLYHPKLNTTFRGTLHPNSAEGAPVVQYRGIKFASIPERWRQSRLFEDYPATYDATKYGPSCPQPHIPLLEDVLNGFTAEKLREINTEESYRFNEFECLNLNIAVPAPAMETTRLPIMICLHGGGHLAGRNSAWFNDGGALVARSVEIGKPVIVVSTNHRLGALGWLASQEMLGHNQRAGDYGVGNYAPHDMHLGIEWIYRNIAAFGGDPDNITLVGESAGSMSVMSQIHLRLPGRFRRAVCQSGVIGTATVMIPSTIDEQEPVYSHLKQHFKVETLDDLRRISGEDLSLAFQKFQPPASGLSRPTLDGVHYDASWRERNASSGVSGWKEFALLIGDVEHEYTVWEYSMLVRKKFLAKKETPPSTTAFIDELSALVPEQKVVPILSEYGISRDTSHEDLLHRLWQILEDASFTYATQSYALNAAAQGATVYRYLFDERNPFGGTSYQTRANHALDLVYIYGASGVFANVEHPDWETPVREDIQGKFLRFAYGERIWKPLHEGGYYAFGPEGRVGEVREDELASRRRVQQWAWVDGLTTKEKWDLVIAVGKQVSMIV